MTKDEIVTLLHDAACTMVYDVDQRWQSVAEWIFTIMDDETFADMCVDNACLCYTSAIPICKAYLGYE